MRARDAAPSERACRGVMPLLSQATCPMASAQRRTPSGRISGHGAARRVPRLPTSSSSPHPGPAMPTPTPFGHRLPFAAGARRSLLAITCAALLVATTSLPSLAQGPVARANGASAVVDPAQMLFGALRWRNIGPANMSGRVSHIEAVESNPAIVFVAAASGGVWKSTNAGATWEPIFEKYGTANIGAVAVFQPNPDIVWV